MTRSLSGTVVLAVVHLFLLAGSALAQQFGPPGGISNAGVTSGGGPRVAHNGAGTLIAVWPSEDTLGGTIGTDGDVLVSRSTDDGLTWSVQEALNANAASDAGDDESPDVVGDSSGEWVVVWSSTDTLGGTIGGDADILVSRSTDDGLTWLAPVALHASAASDGGEQDTTPRVATNGSGNLVVVWQTTAGLGDWRSVVSRSSDNGATWSAPIDLNNGLVSNETTAPDVATDGMGNWVAVWVHGISPDRDIGVARSTDNGATWTAAAILNSDAGEDLWGDFEPDIEVNAATGIWIAAWSRFVDKAVVFARTSDAGATWSDPSLLTSAGFDSNKVDTAPALKADGSGNWTAAWHRAGEAYRNLTARSLDDGLTWSDAGVLFPKPDPEDDSDVAVHLTSNGAGRWVAIMSSYVSGSAGVFVALDGHCDDGNPCTQDLLTPGSICQNLAQPRTQFCFSEPVSTQSKLQIKKPSDPTRNKLSWQWSKGPAFTQAVLGNPLLDTSYALCVYDNDGVSPSLAVGVDVPASPSLWDDNDPKGVSYSDRDGLNDGVTKLQIKTGEAQRTKIKLSAKGSLLTLPNPVGLTYFDQNPSVIAQLVNSEGACWSTEFSPENTSRNLEDYFSAKVK